MAKPISHDDITAIILAGGKGTRLGGVDKGLFVWNERPLIEHVLQRITPQCGHIIVSANRNIANYERYGHPVVEDHVFRDYGPLSGIYNAGQKTETPYLLTIPCDAPTLPLDLVARLAACITAHHAKAAYAHDGEQSQHLYMLFSRELLENLRLFLDSDQRKVRNWLNDCDAVAADFSDNPDAFFNINEVA